MLKFLFIKLVSKEQQKISKQADTYKPENQLKQFTKLALHGAEGFGLGSGGVDADLVPELAAQLAV